MAVACRLLSGHRCLLVNEEAEAGVLDFYCDSFGVSFPWRKILKHNGDTVW